MGYCRIQWQQNAATSPDPFQLDTAASPLSANAAGGIATPAIAVSCSIAYVKIPDGSLDGITAFPSGLMDNAFQNQFCGADLGITVTPPVTPSVSSSIICKSAGRGEHFPWFPLPFCSCDNTFHSWGLDGYSRTGVWTCSVRVQSGLHPGKYSVIKSEWERSLIFLATLLSPQRDLSKKLNNQWRNTKDSICIK